MEVEFCLAQRDPNCLATTGIVRVNGSSVTDYALEGINAGGSAGASETDVKALSRWPNTDYVNIWVVTEIENNNGGSGIQGYAYFPGASSSVDGIVIMHTAFGTLGTVNSFNNLCRTLTHEMGHYFNLYHTFEGDNGGTQCPATGNNCGSGVGDCCGDTEIHQRSSSNCPSGMNTCTSAMFGSVVNNYMDYSSQTCADEFTADQKTRMRAALCGPRASLLSSLGCTPVTTTPPGTAACSPQTTNLSNSFGMGVRNVTFHDLNVTSSNAVNDGGYVDNTCNQAANLAPSTPYNISIFTGTTNNQDVHVYIDYNNDNDFTDPGEQVMTSTNDTLHTLTYTTPANPTTGAYLRMRVIADWVNNTIANSCYAPQYGQIEDFSVFFASTASISLSSTTTDVTCNGGNNGSATVTASNGNIPYTYAWSNGGSTATISNLAAGNYTVTVTDATAATQTTTVTIAQPTTGVTAMIMSSTNVSCNGGFNGAVIANASGGTPTYTYAWSNGASNTSLNGLFAGSYTVTVTDANGCTDAITATITEPALISASSTVSNVTTVGGSNGSISLTPTGGTPTYTYAWSSGSTAQNPTGLVAGVYTVTITDANGCTGTHTATVTQPSPGPLTLSTSFTNVSCNGGNDGTGTANASGGTTPYTYAWSNGNTNATATGLSIGSYNVTVTDGAGATAVGSVSILQPFALGVTLPTITQVACFGDATGAANSTTSGGIPPYTFSWSNGASTANINGLTAGLYTLTVTDANGCTQTAIAGINQPGSALSLTNVVTNVTTAGGTNGAIDITVSGGTPGYAYVWNTAATSEDLNGLSAGTYTVTVTDTNGCVLVQNFNVSQPSLNTSMATVDASCNGLADGSATVTVNSGTPPMTFVWSNGGSSATLTGLAAGTYTVTVTDANGLQGQDTAVINEPGALNVNVNNTNVSCNGANDASATASVFGGTAPVSFSWSNGMSGSGTAMNYGAGTHTVTVTDNNGCTTTANYTVTQPTALSLTGTIVNPGGCNFSSGTLSASGGTTPYSYVWSTGDTTATVANLPAGTYAATVTDANGCTAVQGGLIATSAGSILATLNANNITCNGANDGNITVTISAGAAPFTYLWSSLQTTPSISGLPAGTYTVFVSDSTGCSDTLTATITEPAPIVLNVSGNSPSCDNSNDGDAATLISGGVTPYTFNWSNGGSTNSLSGLSGGTYTVTVTDAGGCTVIDSVTLNSPTPVVATIAPAGPISLCGGASVTLTVNTAIGLSHIWTLNGNPIGGASGPTLNVGVPGQYGVITTDANGCTGSDVVSVTNSPIVVSFSGLDPNGYCESDPPATLTGSPAGGSFSGIGIVGNQFVPDSAGIGTFMIVYNYSDTNGCSGSDTQFVAVTSGANIGGITGPIVVQPNQSYVYQVNPNSGSSYQWIASGGTLGQQANNVASINWGAGPNGSITVVETASNGCTDTLTVIIYIGIVSVAESEASYGIQLYPNPVRSSLFLEVSDAPETPLEIAVWNNLGQLVHRIDLNSGYRQDRYQISVADWAKGLYLVSVVGQEGVELKRIVVQ